MGVNTSHFSEIHGTGKVCIITGGNTGIGLETARELARKNFHVFLACRNEEKAKAAIQNIQDSLELEKCGKLEFLPLDLSSLDSVKLCVQIFLDKKLPLHFLILNAGIYSAADIREVTNDEFEKYFQINYLAHFYFTYLLLDVLVKSAPSKVITIASKLHEDETLDINNLQLETNYTATRACSYSKSCQILFSRELHKRLHFKKVSSFAVHPGVVDTEIYDKDPWYIWIPMYPIKKLFFLSPKVGALTTLYCTLNMDLNWQSGSGLYYSNSMVATEAPWAANDDYAVKLWNLSLALLELNNEERKY